MKAEMYFVYVGQTDFDVSKLDIMEWQREIQRQKDIDLPPASICAKCMQNQCEGRQKP